MGICLDTGKHGFVNGFGSGVAPSTYRSWSQEPVHANGVQHKAIQERTMSEPIMSSREHMTIIPAPSSGPGPGPPRKLPISVKAHAVRPQEIPDIPVIFVLGGPGSGKATYCQRLTHMDQKLVHVNMLQVFVERAAELAGSRDPNSVPAYMALELTVDQMLQVKSATGFIITSYPRNMRDVVEYMAKVQRVDGVILLDWSDRSLERQVKFGARNRHVDQQLARYELENYRSNIIPVAQFFDQQGYLHLVAGEREPAEIFDDLAEEVGGILTYPSGSFRDMNRPTSQNSEHTQAVVHSPDEGQTRRSSVNSVDRMIEEEMQNQLPANPIKVSEEKTYSNPNRREAEDSDAANSDPDIAKATKREVVRDDVLASGQKSNNKEQLPNNVSVPEDVEAILRIVQSDAILQRAASNRPIET